MKILICIPAIVRGDILRETLDSIINRPLVEVIVLDNGGDQSVKDVIKEYTSKGLIIHWTNAINQYVVAPWDEFITHFIAWKDCDYLCIMNSDLALCKDWDTILRNRWKEDPDEIIIPKITDNKDLLEQDRPASIQPAEVVSEGTPGVFITLNRKQAKLVHPLPHEYLKLWYSDDWIYGILRSLGYSTVIPDNFIARHQWSTSVGALPERDQLILQDKAAWRDEVEPMMQEKIKQLKALK